MYRGGLYRFLVENQKETDYRGDIDLDWKIILK
jgi:hypothetical protein